MDDWVGLDVDREMTAEVFWLVIGDWHLDPQGGEHGDVAVEVCDGLDIYRELTVEDWGSWFTAGDWHLEFQGGDRGEAVWKGLKLGKEEILEDRVFWPTIGD